MPLPEPCPDLRSLDLLVSVGELGSISAAAAVHRLSQPAVSMRLRALERLLRISLLERTSKGARLTPAGAATVEWAAAVLSDVEALLAGTAALRENRRPELRIAASLTVAEYLLPQWLRQLASEEPSVRVSLTMGNSTVVSDRVYRGQVDIGFIEGPRPPGRLRSKDLMADELVVVVPRGHPWARRRKGISARELAGTPLVLREPGSGTRDVLMGSLGSRGLQVTAAMELGSTTAIKAAAIAGSGPAVMSALAVRAELQAGQLVAVSCEELSLRRRIRAVWAASRPLSGSAKLLLAIAARSSDNASSAQ